MKPDIYPDLFNYVYGPVMQPGSSSHTAGPCRVGLLAAGLLGEPVRDIHVTLDPAGSFAGAFGIMAEDNAMIAGAMGLGPDDQRLFDAGALARAAGIAYRFDFAPIKESSHPNAMKFRLTGQGGRQVELVGDSTGGGLVETRSIEGFPVRLAGDAHTLLLKDPDSILGPEALAGVARSIPGLIRVESFREPGRGALHVFFSSRPIAPATWPTEVLALEKHGLDPILPVIRPENRKPPLFSTMAEWKEAAAKSNWSLARAVVQYQMDASGWDEKQVREYLRFLTAKMHRQTHAAYEENLPVPESPFKMDYPALWTKHAASGRTLSDGLTAAIIRLAYGAGAGLPGVETVTGPMGSGGGYLYAALYAVMKARRWAEDKLPDGLLVAGGVGLLAFFRTEPTGECLGCTGECGVNGAMAAAGLVEMAGGTPDQVEAAASLSLQGSLGWPCDPIPGGFGQPCRGRIMTSTCMAPVFADMALAGHPAVLSLDEALDAADRVGRALPPELLCTSRGGAAAAPSAREKALAFKKWFEESRKAGRRIPPGNLI
ncbi:MAG: L-serine ammonia-lyase, iron-sulfur-dependent, subunit alpha [Pseudomonadota bacterium]